MEETTDSGNIIDEFIKGSNPINKLIKQEYETLKENIASYFLKSSTLREIENFSKEILKNHWVQYHKLKLNDKDSENYDANSKIFYQEIITYFPDELKTIFNQLAVIIMFIQKEFYKEEYGDPIESFGFMKRTKSKPDEIVEALLLFKFDRGIDQIFDKINEILEKECEIYSLFFGKSGTGKTTLACVSEGFFATITNKVPSERVISDNGRGTDKLEIVPIQVNNVIVNLLDFTGFSDPGKNFENMVIFNQLLTNLKTETGGKVNLDTILYTLDLSSPRLDDSDYDLLKLFMTQMKKGFKNLDYWKSVIVIGTKANLIKLTKYSDNGLPKYEYKKYLKEHSLEASDETLIAYNQLYSKILYQAMEDWKEAITQRVHQKIHDGRLDKDCGQSFNVYFQQITKELYPKMTDDEIKKVFSGIKFAIAGEAMKEEDRPNWDYRNCEIKPIPNFDDVINDQFEHYDYEFMKESYTYCQNWFDDLQNEIKDRSQSNSFKLTVSMLEAMKGSTKQEEKANSIVSEVIEEDASWYQPILNFFKSVWSFFI